MRNVTIAPVKIKGRPRAEVEADARRLLAQRRPRRQARCLSRPALRRPAAARGDRPRAGAEARDPAAGRGDLRARSRARERGAGHHPRPRRRRHDHADRQPRDGLRARGVVARSSSWTRARWSRSGRRRRSSTARRPTAPAASSARSCGTEHGCDRGAGAVPRAAGGLRQSLVRAGRESESPAHRPSCPASASTPR